MRALVSFLATASIFFSAAAVSFLSFSTASDETSMLDNLASALSRHAKTPSISAAYFLVRSLSCCCRNNIFSSAWESAGSADKNAPSSAEISDSVAVRSPRRFPSAFSSSSSLEFRAFSARPNKSDATDSSSWSNPNNAPPPSIATNANVACSRSVSMSCNRRIS